MRWNTPEYHSSGRLFRPGRHTRQPHWPQSGHMSDAPSASSLSDRPEAIRTPGKAAKRWAIVLAALTAVWMGVMLASVLHYRFLDVVAGNRDGPDWRRFLPNAAGIPQSSGGQQHPPHGNQRLRPVLCHLVFPAPVSGRGRGALDRTAAPMGGLSRVRYRVCWAVVPRGVAAGVSLRRCSQQGVLLLRHVLRVPGFPLSCGSGRCISSSCWGWRWCWRD